MEQILLSWQIHFVQFSVPISNIYMNYLLKFVWGSRRYFSKMSQPLSNQWLSKHKSNVLRAHCPHETSSHSERPLDGDQLCDRRYQSQPKKQYKESIRINLHWCKIRPKVLKECVLPVDCIDVQSSTKHLQPSKH